MVVISDYYSFELKQIEIIPHEIIPRGKASKNFINPNFDIEKFILYLSTLESLKNLGVDLETSIKIISCGVNGNRRYPLKLRNIRKNKSENYSTGSSTKGTPMYPGAMTISVCEEGCSAANLMELIIHEYLHCIGMDHGDSMNKMLMTIMKEIIGIDIEYIINTDVYQRKRYSKSNVYYVDFNIIDILEKHWENLGKEIDKHFKIVK